MISHRRPVPTLTVQRPSITNPSGPSPGLAPTSPPTHLRSLSSSRSPPSQRSSEPATQQAYSYSLPAVLHNNNPPSVASPEKGPQQPTSPSSANSSYRLMMPPPLDIGNATVSAIINTATVSTVARTAAVLPSQNPRKTIMKLKHLTVPVSFGIEPEEGDTSKEDDDFDASRSGGGNVNPSGSGAFGRSGTSSNSSPMTTTQPSPRDRGDPSHGSARSRHGSGHAPFIRLEATDSYETYSGMMYNDSFAHSMADSPQHHQLQPTPSDGRHTIHHHRPAPPSSGNHGKGGERTSPRSPSTQSQKSQHPSEHQVLSPSSPPSTGKVEWGGSFRGRRLSERPSNGASSGGPVSPSHDDSLSGPPYPPSRTRRPSFSRQSDASPRSPGCVIQNASFIAEAALFSSPPSSLQRRTSSIFVSEDNSLASPSTNLELAAAQALSNLSPQAPNIRRMSLRRGSFHGTEGLSTSPTSAAAAAAAASLESQPLSASFAAIVDGGATDDASGGGDRTKRAWERAVQIRLADAAQRAEMQKIADARLAVAADRRADIGSAERERMKRLAMWQIAVRMAAFMKRGLDRIESQRIETETRRRRMIPIFITVLRRSLRRARSRIAERREPHRPTGAQLASDPVLGLFPKEQLNHAASGMELRYYYDRERIVWMGLEEDEAFVLHEGTADVMMGATRVTTLHPGSVFGTVGMISGEPRTATIIVRSGPCYVWVLKRSVFEACAGTASQQQLAAAHAKLSEMRTSNFKTVYQAQLQPTALARFPLLCGAQSETLRGIATEDVTPRVIRRGTTLVRDLGVGSPMLLLRGTVAVMLTFASWERYSRSSCAMPLHVALRQLVEIPGSGGITMAAVHPSSSSSNTHAHHRPHPHHVNSHPAHRFVGVDDVASLFPKIEAPPAEDEEEEEDARNPATTLADLVTSFAQHSLSELLHTPTGNDASKRRMIVSPEPIEICTIKAPAALFLAPVLLGHGSSHHTALPFTLMALSDCDVLMISRAQLQSLDIVDEALLQQNALNLKCEFHRPMSSSEVAEALLRCASSQSHSNSGGGKGNSTAGMNDDDLSASVATVLRRVVRQSSRRPGHSSPATTSNSQASGGGIPNEPWVYAANSWLSFDPQSDFMVHVIVSGDLEGGDGSHGGAASSSPTSSMSHDAAASPRRRSTVASIKLVESATAAAHVWPPLCEAWFAASNMRVKTQSEVVAMRIRRADLVQWIASEALKPVVHPGEGIAVARQAASDAVFGFVRALALQQVARRRRLCDTAGSSMPMFSTFGLEECDASSSASATVAKGGGGGAAKRGSVAAAVLQTAPWLAALLTITKAVVFDSRRTSRIATGRSHSITAAGSAQTASSSGAASSAAPSQLAQEGSGALEKDTGDGESGGTTLHAYSFGDEDEGLEESVRSETDDPEDEDDDEDEAEEYFMWWEPNRVVRKERLLERRASMRLQAELQALQEGDGEDGDETYAPPPAAATPSTVTTSMPLSQQQQPQPLPHFSSVTKSFSGSSCGDDEDDMEEGVDSGDGMGWMPMPGMQTGGIGGGHQQQSTTTTAARDGSSKSSSTMGTSSSSGFRNSSVTVYHRRSNAVPMHIQMRQSRSASSNQPARVQALRQHGIIGYPQMQRMSASVSASSASTSSVPQPSLRSPQHRNTRATSCTSSSTSSQNPQRRPAIATTTTATTARRSTNGEVSPARVQQLLRYLDDDSGLIRPPD